MSGRFSFERGVEGAIAVEAVGLGLFMVRGIRPGVLEEEEDWMAVVSVRRREVVVRERWARRND